MNGYYVKSINIAHDAIDYTSCKVKDIFLGHLPLLRHLYSSPLDNLIFTLLWFPSEVLLSYVVRLVLAQ